jgi:hypothetical protein
MKIISIGIKKNPSGSTLPKTTNKPVDEKLLADGLGAFLDVFINYHTGPEGDTLSQWIIDVCKDQRFAVVVPKLQQFHKLMGEIYQDIIELSKDDDNVGRKVANTLCAVKTAQQYLHHQPVADVATLESVSMSLLKWMSSLSKRSPRNLYPELQEVQIKKRINSCAQSLLQAVQEQR